jgi:hypothetical protein
MNVFLRWLAMYEQRASAGNELCGFYISTGQIGSNLWEASWARALSISAD